ncbi:MAG: S46 family peptidase [Bacteroidales bacterium]|nr:S46 family peptidase [Bacteroidales bacterium]
MKKIFVFVFLLSIFIKPLLADEGMWLPFLLNQTNMDKMHEMGLQLTKDDIYQVNNSSLKDAIVIFGGGCTGEIISDQGLLLTNMHCGYRQIQSHTTIENDYLKNGFAAAELKDELPNEGLTVKFLIRVDDVSEKVNAKLKNITEESERTKIINEISKQLEQEAVEGTHYDGLFKSYYNGNQFYVLVYEIYKDVRLVANPPVAIGDFGSLTDNWMWPRHKADFSIFRVYTAPDGTPAEYSPENIPLKPKHYLPVSLKGAQPDDFAMILGNPGSTDRHMTSYGIKELIDISNPNRIKIRGAKLEIMNETMSISPAHRIMYAAKYKGSSNYWKYSVAQMAGFERNNVIEHRKDLEKHFTNWVAKDKNRVDEYASTLKQIKEAYSERKEYKHASQYLYETVLRGPEIFGFASKIYNLNTELNKGFFKKDKKKIKLLTDEISSFGEKYFRDYDKETDKKISIALFKILNDDINSKYFPEEFKTALKEYNGNIESFVNGLYSQSILANEQAFLNFIEKPSKKILNNDPGYNTGIVFWRKYYDIYDQSKSFDEQLAVAKRQYMKGLMEMQTERNFYPDANFTMRLTYGKVGGYSPKNGMYYRHYTTLKGVMEKEDPNNYEFIVPEKLKSLYEAKDYGRFGYGDDMRVCFTTNNDITGGNSGSPVINGKGELIGLAFDSNWEGMTGDIEFEQKMQKTVCTDIKYIVWLLEKYMGAQRLVDELTFVE